jgi:hypothetical protein
LRVKHFIDFSKAGCHFLDGNTPALLVFGPEMIILHIKTVRPKAGFSIDYKYSFEEKNAYD